MIRTVDSDRTPRPGQVYRSPGGRPVLYVRTEQRPGADEPEHLFVEAHDRVVFERWLPGGALPEALVLTFDPEATERAEAKEREMTWLRLERDALVAAMKRAVQSVPVSVANDLRRVYREHAGAALTRSAS